MDLHQSVVAIAVELVLLGLSAVIAGEGDGAANVMIAVWATLLLLWAIHHFTQPPA